MLPSRMQGWFLLLQRFPIPLPQLRCGIVGALSKIEQDGVRAFSSTHCVVWQNELAQLGLIKGCVWLNLRFCESRRFRVCVRIENRCRHRGIARPETQAAHLLRISLARDRVRKMWYSPGMRWRFSTGETRHCQIKAAPEKMHRTAFPTKA